MSIPTLTTLKADSNAEISKLAAYAPSVGAFVVSFAVVFFIVWPKFSEVLRLRAANSELSASVELLAKKADILEVYAEDKDQLEVQLGAADQMLPSDKGVFTLIAQIEGAARSSGALLNKLDIAPGSVNANQSKSAGGAQAVVTPTSVPPVTGDPPTIPGAETGVGQAAPKVQTKLSVTSDYKSFLQFIKNLLSLSRVVEVKDLSVAAAEGSGQVRASLTVEAYWQALPRELSAIESPVETLTGEEEEKLSRVTDTGHITTPTLPTVPLGRSDLFAPY